MLQVVGSKSALRIRHENRAHTYLLADPSLHNQTCRMLTLCALAMYRSAGYRYVATDYNSQLASFPEWMLIEAGVEKDEVLLIKRL
eukprot:7827757-Pyramimonas_sp.AAC.1